MKLLVIAKYDLLMTKYDLLIITKYDQAKNKLTLDMPNGQQGRQGASLRKAATGMIISCARNFHIMEVAAIFFPHIFFNPLLSLIPHLKRETTSKDRQDQL